MQNNLKSEFSWSISRHNIFEYCERAYYFHYYGSWNGWTQYSDDLSIQLFKLKHLQTKELWLIHIICNSFKMAIAKQIVPDFSNIKKYVIKFILKDISSLKIKNWMDDPKQINLFSTYYEYADIDSIKTWALNNYFSHLHTNKTLNTLLKIPLTMQKCHDNNFKYFKINKLKIWLNPLSIYSYNKKLIAFNFNFDLSDSSNWSLSTALSELYILVHWKPKINDIVTPTLFVKENRNYTVYAKRNLKEVIQIVNKSTLKMKSRLSYTQKAYIDNFDKTTDQKKCHTCRFKEACMTK